MSSAGFALSSLRDADTAGTHAAVHVCVQSDSGWRKRQIPLLSQHYLIARFLQPTHDRTRAAKNRRPFFSPPCFASPSHSPEKGGGGGASAFDLALRPTFATPRCCLGRSYLLCLPLKRLKRRTAAFTERRVRACSGASRVFQSGWSRDLHQEINLRVKTER